MARPSKVRLVPRFQVGDRVKTPAGHLARVVALLPDQRVDLVYMSGPDLAQGVALPVHLVRGV